MNKDTRNRKFGRSSMTRFRDHVQCHTSTDRPERCSDRSSGWGEGGWLAALPHLRDDRVQRLQSQHRAAISMDKHYPRGGETQMRV